MEQTNSATDFRVGPIISRSFSLIFSSPVVFLGIPLIGLVISLVLGLLCGLIFGRFATLPSRFLGLVLNSMLQGAIAYAVYQILRGQRPGVGESLSKGMQRLFPLVCAAILYWLGVFLGTLLLIIPGLILVCMWAVTVPVCVVESLGPVESIQRSADLTKGYRLHIFGIYLLLFLALLLLVFFTGIVAAILPTFLAVIIVALLMLVPTSLYCTVGVIMYYDLLAIKEGTTVDALANVFD